jgi:hypothetical protein
MKAILTMATLVALFGSFPVSAKESRKPSSDYKLKDLEFSNGAKVESVLRTSGTDEGDTTYSQITDEKNGVVCYAVSKSVSCVKTK